MKLIIALLVLALLFTGAIALGLSFFLLSARSALQEPNPLAISIADAGKAFLVPGDVQAMANPIPSSEEALLAGKQTYSARCAICHGVDGKGATTIGSHMYPRAADLTSARTQSKSDGTLFWIIQNGLPHTGMPGWQDTLKDDQIWQLVGLIRQLPQGMPAAAEPTPAPTTPSTTTTSGSTVNISNEVYEPGAITVAQGTTVVWVNHDEDDHTVTSSVGAPQVLNSPNIKQNEQFEFTFTEKGTFPYFCQVHDYMTGTVVVE